MARDLISFPLTLVPLLRWEVLSLRNDNNLAAISFSHAYPKELHFSHALPAIIIIATPLNEEAQEAINIPVPQ